MEKIKNPIRFVILLVTISTIGPVALNMPVPALPRLVEAFSTTAENVQLTLTLYLLGMGTSQILMGPLSDRFGRRPIVLIGLFIGAIFSIVALFAPTIEILILSRFMQAVGATSGVVLGRAMIRDLFEKDKAASMIGWVTMGMMIGPMITPLIGGYMTVSLGAASIFAAIAFMTTVAFIFALVDLPETKKIGLIPPTFKSLFNDCLELVREKQFWGYCLLGSFASVTFFAFLGAAPFIVINMMGATPAEYGAWFALSALGYAIGNFFCGKYGESWGTDRLIIIGAWVGITAAFSHLVFYSLGWLISPFWLMVPQAVIAIANGFQLPTSMACALSVKPKIAGIAAGLNGFIQLTIGAIGAQFAGWITAVTGSVLPLLIILFISVILAYLSYKLLVKK